MKESTKLVWLGVALSIILYVLGVEITFAATFDQAQKVYYKLGGRSQLYLYHGENNSYTNFNGVWISSEMLSYVRNEDELALVLGHEIGHSQCPRYGWAAEYCSDARGVQLANRAGFNGCRGALILKRFEGGKSHPYGYMRYKNTGC